MPWYDDGEPVPNRPARPGQEPFSLVRGRGLQAFIVVVGAVVVAAGSLAVARIGDDSPASDVRAAGDQTTTDRLAGSPSVTSGPPSSPPRSVPPAAPETTLPGADPGPTPAPENTSPPPPPVARAEACAPEEVVVTASPDRAVYPRGQDVIVTATARNQSSRPCDPRDPTVEIRDTTGALTVRMGAADFTELLVPWPPNGELTKSFTWNRTVCNDEGCERASSGTYTASAVFGEYRSGRAPFEIQ